ncbi:MAG: hypothetical protein ACU0BF_04695 [Paracoccaceae bacterium]
MNSLYASEGGDGFDDSKYELVLTYQIMISIINAPRPGVSIRKEVFPAIIASGAMNARVKKAESGEYALGLCRGLISRTECLCKRVWPPIRVSATPKEDWRFLFCFALSFIIEHEYAHISNGHLDYQARQAATMSTLNNSAGKETTAFTDSQTLEMDADACAATRTFTWLFHTWVLGRVHGFPKCELRCPEKMTFTQMLVTYVDAIFVAVAVSGVRDCSVEEISKVRHLSRSARTCHSIGLLREIEKTLLPQAKITKEDWQAIEERVKHLSNSGLLGDHLNLDIVNAYLAPHTGFIHQLTRNWNSRLRRELEPFSIGPLMH